MCSDLCLPNSVLKGQEADRFLARSQHYWRKISSTLEKVIKEEVLFFVCVVCVWMCVCSICSFAL